MNKEVASRIDLYLKGNAISNTVFCDIIKNNIKLNTYRKDKVHGKFVF
jgi:hypothetical protein